MKNKDSFLNDSSQITIISATEQNADVWGSIFLDGMRDCPWMIKYLSRKKISKMDVSLSFLEDYQNPESKELFFIAYYNNESAGIIRVNDYWLPNSMKILSHFPLVRARYQRRGIGRALINRVIKEIFEQGNEDVWAECWSQDMREINAYSGFYQAVGLMKKSDRIEMSCDVSNKCTDIIDIEGLVIEKTKEITNSIIKTISLAYGESEDRLHKIENLDDPAITEVFLKKTKKTLENAHFEINLYLGYLESKLCAVLMTGTSDSKGMIVEIGVLPSYRGKKIAQKLISIYFQELTRKGIKTVSLGVDKENIKAIRLYEKLGFETSWYGALYRYEKE
jgi:ribosomal protein S18 acetylase RimI-like enzyme